MKSFQWRTVLCLLFISSLALTSCEKDENKVSNTDKITGTWKLTAMTVDPAIDWFGTQVTNLYAQLPACTKDDLTIFQSNGVVKLDEGDSKCEVSDPQTQTGTWTFNTSESTISVTTDGETESWEINELTKDRFSVDYIVEDEEEGITYTFTATYVKQ